MLVEYMEEARRQIGICNACRYCEGYCSVFPSMHRERHFTQGDLTMLANLCHNCRSCYYACQYTEPHEFALNIPKVFAEVRQESWREHTVPRAFANMFHISGMAVASVTIIGLAALLWTIQMFGGPTEGEGFYGVLSHNTMVTLFAPAFVIPMILIGVSLKRYWKTIGGAGIGWREVLTAFQDAGRMRNLSGGHGDGCNFEDDDRYSQSRRHHHQAAMYGFLLCFASTCTATIMHYLFNMPAPHGLVSLPKILGVSGGVLLCIGALGLAVLKFKAERHLSDNRVWGGEMGFIFLLFFVSASGLALYAAGTSNWLNELLIIHLGSVLAFFVLMPYSKMVHGFYRLLTLVREAQKSASASS